MRSRWLIAVLVLAGAAHAAPADPAATVEADLFSGRPNPIWRLTARQTAALLRRISALKPASDSPPSAPALGYRGLQVTIPRDANSQTFTVRRGYVSLSNGSTLLDTKRNLERFLLATGKRKLDPGVIALLEQELRNP